jgi:glycosyltransferase involved in cell wall biosynthesis
MSKSELSIVLPCYNPAHGWQDNVIGSYSRLKVFLPQVKLLLYIVNDGSTKNCNEKAIEILKARIPDLNFINYSQNQGKGYALRKGMEQVQTELCIYTDIDFPYEEENIAELYLKLSAGEADIIAGVRDEAYYSNVPAGRVKISKILKYFTGKFLRIPIKDTQCGLKGFNRKGKVVFMQTTIKRYLFDLEFIYLASHDKTVTLLPCKVRLKTNVVFSAMNIKILFRESLSFLNMIRRYYFSS